MSTKESKPTSKYGGYKYTPEVVNRLNEGLLMGLTIDQACTYAGIHRDTYYDWCKKVKGFQEQMERAQLNPFLKAKQTIFNNLDKTDVAQWYLEHKARQEFSTRTETDFTMTEAPVIIDDIPEEKAAKKGK